MTEPTVVLDAGSGVLMVALIMILGLGTVLSYVTLLHDFNRTGKIKNIIKSTTTLILAVLTSVVTLYTMHLGGLL